MAGESHWTLETLKEYIESLFKAQEALTKAQADLNDVRFQGQEKAVEAALAAAKEALEKLERDYRDKFANVNEFRETLRDQAEKFMPRAEAMALVTGLKDQLEEVKRDGSKRDNEMKERLDKTEGKSKGISATTAIILAIIPIALSIILVMTR